MPTITEDLDLPDGVAPASVRVELQLWGSGEPVTGYETGTQKTIAGVARTTGSEWQITNVVGNSAIDLPAGTVYRAIRTWPGLVDPLLDYITVPASGGPYRLDQILTDPPDALPTVTASNELQVAEIAANVTGLSVNGFNIVAVPGLTIPVAVNTRPIYIRAQLWLEHSVANVSLSTLIAPVGSSIIGQQIAAGTGFVAAIGKETSPFAEARIAPGGSGSYQAFVYGDVAGNVTVIANASSPARIASFAM